LETLELDPDEPVAPQYMTLFYDAAKDVFDHDKTQLRTYFAWLYFVIFQRKEGPRWGEFVQVYGAANFTAFVRQRFQELV
jgi:lysyl-tRNA synthetase class I